MCVKRFGLLLLLATWWLSGCVGPRSAVEVYRLRDLVREGQTEHLIDLTTALGSSDENVKSAAISALAELGPVATGALQETVQEESKRSGPALRALGRSGEAEVIGFVRLYKTHPLLAASAIDAEAELERKLYARVQQGEFEAMEAYLDAFPKSSKLDEVKAIRRDRLAKQALERARTSGSLEELEAFLTRYADNEDAPKVRLMLARMMIKEGLARIEAQEYEEARVIVSRAGEFDPARVTDVERVTAQAYLEEGKVLRASGEKDPAAAAFEEAAKYPDYRVEANRLLAEILLEQAKKQLEAGAIYEGAVLLGKIGTLDPSRARELQQVKRELLDALQAQMESEDQAIRRQGLIGMISLGAEAVRPMEMHLGQLFVKKGYASVEGVVQAIAEVKKGLPPDQPDPGVERIRALLVQYLKAAFDASTSEVLRLFGSQDFIHLWKPDIDPVDPRQYPLIYKVEGTTLRHMGLSRVVLSTRILLDAKTLPFVEGSLLREEEARGRVARGEIGQDPSLPLITRVQLSAHYSKILAEFSRLLESNPERFMEYAVGLSISPYTTQDWLLVVEGFKRAASDLEDGQRIDVSGARSGLRTNNTTLVTLEFDHRSLTLLVYDPVVDRLGSATVTDRAEAAQRTLALMLNTARIAFGLFAGMDRYTVMIGSTERPRTSSSRVRGGQFNPETRMMLSQKNFARINWEAIRNLNGAYTAGELELIDLKWYRWQK